MGEFVVSDTTVHFWPKEVLTHAAGSDDVLLLVAENQAIVGFLVVNYNKGLKKALVENLYVQPGSRGQGVGAALLSEMLRLLPTMDCEYVATLVPLNAQSAIELYASNGFNEGEQFIWLDKNLTDTLKR